MTSAATWTTNSSQAVAENGGVVQTVAFRSYLNSAKNSAFQDAMGVIEEEIAAEMGIELLDRAGIQALPEAERGPYFEAGDGGPASGPGP